MVKQLKLDDFEGKQEVPATIISINIPAYVKERLTDSLNEWLNKHRDMLGSWHDKMVKELNKFRKMQPKIPAVAGFGMWLFCVLNNIGVTATIGRDGFAILDSTWKRGFDRKTTEKLMLWIQQAVRLTNIHPEFAKKVGWG